ncbi:nitrate/nitrite transporter NrtS [Glaciecola sp. XM2]|uniref:nitrate/nitrite transporter NrtS n=1 Tax=Glaciecola sp. XM2 TaxID=1914931 RepID=UPI001BDF2E31|nr:nitrate/nitrite transporter NrtS [Glaciecola sp. XM2]MBT1450264.1 nitrate/nitrite transporter NrtS [Glaciecola sp. XM2]
MRSLLTLLIVGSILNMINQQDAIFAIAEISWANMLLTFVVPFLVSTFSGTAAALQCQQQRTNEHQYRCNNGAQLANEDMSSHIVTE